VVGRTGPARAVGSCRGALEWDGATADGRRARLIIVFRTHPPIRRFTLPLRGHNSGPFHSSNCSHSNFDGILPTRCHLHSPCFRLLSNRCGGAPWYTLNTLYYNHTAHHGDTAKSGMVPCSPARSPSLCISWVKYRPRLQADALGTLVVAGQRRPPCTRRSVELSEGARRSEWVEERRASPADFSALEQLGSRAEAPLSCAGTAARTRSRVS